MLVQTLRILFNFILKSCVEFVDNTSFLETTYSKRVIKGNVPGNDLNSKSHVFAPQINHDTGLWDSGCTPYKAIYVLWL